MARTVLSHSKIPTRNPQLSLAEGGEAAAPARARTRRAPRGAATLVNGDLRRGTRGEGRVVMEVEGGVTVYPARHPGTGGGQSGTRMGVGRRQCQAATEEGLARRSPPGSPARSRTSTARFTD
jgi:hypothetical protein